MPSKATPEEYRKLNVQVATYENNLDGSGHPTGGNVAGMGLDIRWQDGPRTPDAEGRLAPSNGAFVEDVIYAAIQRLEFFNDSKFATDENTEAIGHLKHALNWLDKRRQDRKNRNVEGKHEV